MKLLITGFNPFNNQLKNTSFEAVKLIDENLSDITLLKAELPTEYTTGAQALKKLVEENAPNIVICVGQAGGRKKISLEQLAVNYLSATIPDNAGISKHGEKINPNGQTALATTINIQTLVDKLNSKHNIFETSYSAGTFVCNEVYYNLLQLVNEQKVKFGLFVHVPFSTSEAIGSLPCMELSEIAQGLTDIINCILTNDF